MASDMLVQHFHLIQSALGQKVEAKPRGWCPRECSQGRTARHGREVACLPGRMGLPLGRSRRRASPFRAKSARLATRPAVLGAVFAVSGAPSAPVRHAITFCTWIIRFTDEVPRRPGPSGWVTADYKSYAKGLPDASGAGTGSPRPRPKGYQQRRSRKTSGRMAAQRPSERQNHRVPRGPGRSMGPVSPADTVTKWPDGTSSRQPAGLLRNSPQQPAIVTWQFVYVRRNQHGLVSHRQA
jgi:hypothetical protein